MSFNVMGITCGRKNSNSEILLKESLLSCKKQGANITMINLRDFNILDCTGCTSCTQSMTNGKYTGCILDDRDDKKAIMDVMLNQDAVIFSIPTYDLMPSATFLKFMHRNLSYATTFLETIGAIEHRDRIASIISVGGSTRSWQSIALEAIQATAFINDFQIIDMLLATRVPAPKQCLLNDDLIKKASKVGNNIMKSLNTSVPDRKWLGDDDMGWCPNCHSNALILGEPQWDGTYFPIECQVCGAGGTLEQTKDGKWKFVIAENGLSKDRTCFEGSKAHFDEIAHTQGGFYTEKNLSIVTEKFKKYKDLKFPGIVIKRD